MYDYAPTPRGIHGAVEEALKQEKELLRPGDGELAQVQERERLPEDEKQLHSLLMAEGDLAAGELDIPAKWLDSLAREGRALYLEQGLWIAAEQEEEYMAALGPEASGEGEDVPGKKERLHIVRRMLRYRGAADAAQVGERYGWKAAEAADILEELCRRGEAVCQEGQYYHAALYRRARMRTVQNRREEIRTCPAEAYAAVLLERVAQNAPAEEGVKNTLEQYAGTAFPAAFWEGIVLPGRIRNYREALLDQFLAKGELFWHMEGKGSLRFDRQEEIDWDADLGDRTEGLGEKERLLYEALRKRGASFMQALNGVLSGESPHETLLSLLEKGLVYADSFVPVRQWLAQEKTRKASARARVNLRVKALHAGRWDVVRPLQVQAVENRLASCFHRYLIVCRETAAACGLPWAEALSVLRIREYTGQVRRGYFVEGFSGAQFMRAEDYAGLIRELAEPEKRLIWINAADPAQPWGKLLSHREGKAFLNIPGNAVACHGGVPVAAMEKQGKALRIWDEGVQEECLRLFAQSYQKGSLFPQQKRIVVKEYSPSAVCALTAAGFHREMQDYVLYR